MPQLSEHEIAERAQRLAGAQLNLEKQRDGWKKDVNDVRKRCKREEKEVLDEIRRLSREIKSRQTEPVQEKLPVQAGSGPDTPKPAPPKEKRATQAAPPAPPAPPASPTPKTDEMAKAVGLEPDDIDAPVANAAGGIDTVPEGPYLAGFQAQQAGKRLDENPYNAETHTDEYRGWALGWKTAAQDGDTAGVRKEYSEGVAAFLEKRKRESNPYKDARGQDGATKRASWDEGYDDAEERSQQAGDAAGEPEPPKDEKPKKGGRK